MLNIKLPTKATLILSIIATGLAVLNETSFGFGPTWAAGVLIALGLLSALGISRLTGEQFRSIIDLTNAEASSVSAVLAALALWAKSATLSTTWHAIISGVIVIASGLLFGPDTKAAVASLRAAHRKQRVELRAHRARR